ncbi:MAG: hypothetical protein ACXVRS_17560 [Gaiellaceae bacterium]
MTTRTRLMPAAVGALAGVPAKVIGVATGPSGRIWVGWGADLAKVTGPGGASTVVATITGSGYRVFQPKVHF